MMDVTWFGRRLLMAGALVSGFAAVGQNPQAILDTFEIHPEFDIELVAMEPIVFDPVDIEFDEHGRLFVIEMPGYPFPDPNGSVVLLEDTDGDGVYDRRTVFADNFPVADSILPWRGGILVASPPDLVFVKDTTGDNTADVREVLLTGFNVGNTQHNYNGLTYGLDNWIYAASGGNAGEIYWPGRENEKVRLGYQDLRFDLDRQVLEIIGRSSGGFELALDSYGRIFETHNLHHISHLVMPGRYVDRLPLGWSGNLTQISDHDEGGLSRIYPIGVQETRVNHPEQSGYFSGACGITYYGGNAFPEEFNGNIFVCDVVLNLVHRDIIHPHGATFTASRGRQGVEFLASSDRWFRPVNLQTGPDGALYVVDMHRGVIEHPEWIPDEIQQHLDIEAGKDKGRIFRITPKSGLARPTEFFSRDHPERAVAALGHGNKWWRDTAQRLLIEWRDADTVEPITRLATNSPDPKARVHALWTLEGMGHLTDATLAAALSADTAGVRENALVMAEPRLDQSAALREAAAKRADDEDTRVRMQAALTLGTMSAGNHADALDALQRIAERDLDEPWVRLALASAFQNRPLELVTLLLADEPWNRANGAAPLLALIAELLGRDDSPAHVASAVGLHAAYTGPAANVAAGLNGLAAGLRNRPAASGKVDGAAISGAIDRLMNSGAKRVVEGAWRVADVAGLPPTPTQAAMLDAAAQEVMRREASVRDRVDSLALYAFAPFDDRAETLYALLDTREPRELQVAAIHQLAGEGSQAVAERLLDLWPTLGPEVRVHGGNMFLRRPQLHAALLTALETGRLSVGELNFDLERRRTLLFSRDAGIRERAEALFTDAGVVTRREAIEAMRPALELAGDPERGLVIYRELCAQCHMKGSEGIDLGPNLTEIARKSAETLLHDILDPNAAVDTQFISFSITTMGEDVFGGEIITGIITHETTDSITVREAGGEERVILREHIEDMRSTGLSLMPEELEAGMEPQDMADLLAFLQTL